MVDFKKLRGDVWTDKLIDLAQDKMTKKGFSLLLFIENKIPDIWNKFSSSTQKYHKTSDGVVDTIAKHTYEMLWAASNITRMFDGEDYEHKSKQRDAIYFAIVMHDVLKYGPEGKYFHTVCNHDKQAMDFLTNHKKSMLKYFTPEEVELILLMVRMHNGQWSVKKAERPNFKFNDYPVECVFVHILDFLSTKDCLKV